MVYANNYETMSKFVSPSTVFWLSILKRQKRTANLAPILTHRTRQHHTLADVDHTES